MHLGMHINGDAERNRNRKFTPFGVNFMRAKYYTGLPRNGDVEDTGTHLTLGCVWVWPDAALHCSLLPVNGHHQSTTGPEWVSQPTPFPPE